MASSDFLSFLTNGQTPPVVDTTTGTQSSLPLWYSQALAATAGAAGQVASTPYQQFPGPQVAPFAPAQVAAQNYAQTNATNWQPALQSATGAATAGAAPFDPNQLNNFMNPYTGSVVNEIQRLGLQNLNENLNPALQDTFVGTGGFGSGVDQNATAKLMRDTGQNILGQQSQALQGGFQNAMQNYQGFQGLQQSGASGLSNIASNTAGLNAQTTGLLDTVGAEQQGQQQQNINAAMNTFNQELQYPYQQVSFMNSILQGLQPPSSATTTTQAPFSGSMSPSPLAQLASLYGISQGISPTAKPVAA